MFNHELCGRLRRASAKLVGEETAATATETAFVLAVVLVIVIGAISALGVRNSSVWASIASTLDNAVTAGSGS